MRPRPPRHLAGLVRMWAPVAVLLIGMGAAAGAPDPAETIAKVVRDLGLQTEMPKDAPPPPPPQWSGLHWHIPGGLAEWLLWGALAVGFGFALYALRDTLPGISRRTRVKPDAATVLPVTQSLERMQETGDDADALARRGLFAEAMHMLLLRSLAELRKRLDLTLADSLTSREILERLAVPGAGLSLPEPGRQALGDLIRRVEFVHFGRQVAAPEDYGSCRASYEQLIGAMAAPLAIAA